MSSTPDHGGNIFSTARRLGTAATGITDFSASINPLGLSPLVKQAVASALDSLVHYPDTSHEELKQALADLHGVPSSAIVVTNGSTELIYRLPGLLPGRRALIVSPAFSEYERALAQHQWEVRPFILKPEDDFGIDPELLEQALAEGYDALYLCNPGNPSARLYPPQLVARIHDLCRASGTFLVLDEAFMDFCEEASAKGFIAADHHGIVLRSMTKFFAIPGLRLGYAIANQALAGRIEAMGAPWSVNTLAQVAGVAAIHDRGHNQQTIAFVREERSYLRERLSRFPMLTVYPSDANFLLVELTNGVTAAELQQRLIDSRLLIRDCSNFTGLTPHFFRIAVRTREENGQLLQCLERILG